MSNCRASIFNAFNNLNQELFDIARQFGAWTDAIQLVLRDYGELFIFDLGSFEMREFSEVSAIESRSRGYALLYPELKRLINRYNAVLNGLLQFNEIEKKERHLIRDLPIQIPHIVGDRFVEYYEFLRDHAEGRDREYELIKLREETIKKNEEARRATINRISQLILDYSEFTFSDYERELIYYAYQLDYHFKKIKSLNFKEELIPLDKFDVSKYAESYEIIMGCKVSRRDWWGLKSMGFDFRGFSEILQALEHLRDNEHLLSCEIGTFCDTMLQLLQNEWSHDLDLAKALYRRTYRSLHSNLLVIDVITFFEINHALKRIPKNILNSLDF